MGNIQSSARIQRYVLGGIFLVFMLALFTYSVFIKRQTSFDDAFITFRYAKNLANGDGIVWNVGDSPTEGYTNFFIVILLAPAIKIGLDPFLVMRTINILSVFGILASILYSARKYFGMNLLSAFLASLLILHPASAFVAMLGLETSLYSLSLLLVILSFTAYLEEQQKKNLATFAIFSLLTFWLRPEGAILVIICLLYLLKERNRLVSLKETVVILGIALFAPLTLYLIWKYWYFGYLLPNPFYIKVPGGLFSVQGFVSVNYYLTSQLALITLAVFSAADSQRPKHLYPLCALFVISNILFFVTVDTLQDAYSRFLYPLTPLIIILALPALRRFFDYLQNKTNLMLKVMLLLLFGVIITANCEKNIFFAFTLSNEELRSPPPPNIYSEELKVAKKLKQYPQIKNLTIAIPDAGLIPFFTEANTLDVVGLNDSYIAHEKDKGKLKDYFFAREPDLVFLPAYKQRSWVRDGHGPLGDYAEFTRDRRWLNYRYSGSIDVVAYQYHLFVRKNYVYAPELFRFIRRNIAHVYLEPFRLSIGQGSK